MERDIIADIRKVFDTEIAELENVKNSLDEEMVKKIVTLLSQCDGKVVLSGMGKPGHIGRKISATMSSLGISSYFLHPAEALHGDLGTLSQDDVIIIISNSGETAEVCNMLPNIKMIGTPIDTGTVCGLSVGTAGDAGSLCTAPCTYLKYHRRAGDGRCISSGAFGDEAV